MRGGAGERLRAVRLTRKAGWTTGRNMEIERTPAGREAQSKNGYV